MTTRFAIVGTGAISARHADVIRSMEGETELVAVVSRNEDRAAQWARRHGARAFASVTQAVAEASVDVVVVCTETGTHADRAVEAIDAGAHVIIEKPADVSLPQIDRIVEARRRAGVRVGVVSQHRFDSATERVLEAVQSGRLGRITSAVGSLALWRDQAYYDSAAWRGTRLLDGGGALMNQGVHVVDVLLALMGPAQEVVGYSTSLAHGGIEVEDIAVGAIRFASGALGVLHASTAAYPGGDVVIQVNGDKGRASIRNDRLEWLGTSSVRDESVGDALRGQYANFLRAVAGQEPVRVGLEDSRAAVAVITGLYESSRRGAPVRLAT